MWADDDIGIIDRSVILFFFFFWQNVGDSFVLTTIFHSNILWLFVFYPCLNSKWVWSSAVQEYPNKMQIIEHENLVFGSLYNIKFERRKQSSERMQRNNCGSTSREVSVSILNLLDNR